MIINKIDKARKLPVPSATDDPGIDTEIGVVRSTTEQVAHVAAGMADKVDHTDPLSTVEASYALALAEQMEIKRTQANSLEQRLMKQSQQQAERLGKLKQSAPRTLSLPATKRLWKNEVRKEANRLSTTQARLDSVRQARDGMGLLIPRLQEIAAEKLRRLDPGLVGARNEAKRLERAEVQRNSMEKGSKGRDQERPKSRSRSLDLAG